MSPTETPIRMPVKRETENLPQQDMSVHVAFECSWRRINCEYCQESVLSHKKQVCRYHQHVILILLFFSFRAIHSSLRLTRSLSVIPYWQLRAIDVQYGNERGFFYNYKHRGGAYPWPHITSSLPWLKLWVFVFLFPPFQWNLKRHASVIKLQMPALGGEFLVHFKGDFERLYGISNCGKCYVLIFLSCWATSLI